MSEKKYSNEFLHRSQMVIPLPPYLWKFLSFGERHRFNMPFHILYASVWLIPCFVAFFALVSLRRHPHDRLCPYLTYNALVVTVDPQSQEHTHLKTPFSCKTEWTKSLPNLFPGRYVSNLLLTRRAQAGDSFSASFILKVWLRLARPPRQGRFSCFDSLCFIANFK